MTCSKDKSIKLWKFPDIWVDEEGVEKAIIPSIAMKQPVQQAKSNDGLDSDSDEDFKQPTNRQLFEEHSQQPQPSFKPAEVKKSDVKSEVKPVTMSKDDSSDSDLDGWAN